MIDDGRIEDGHRRLDCRHVMALGTLSSRQPAEPGINRSTSSPSTSNPSPSPSDPSAAVLTSLSRELAASVRQVVHLAPLPWEAACQVVAQKLRVLNARLAAWQGQELSWSPEAVELLVHSAGGVAEGEAGADGHKLAHSCARLVEMPLVGDLTRTPPAAAVSISVMDGALQFSHAADV